MHKESTATNTEQIAKPPANEALPRYNHYVPVFILNYFATRGRICVFDKHTLKNFKLPTKRAMCERDYNNVCTNDLVISFENRFSHIENLAAPIVATIVQHKSLDHLCDMDLAALHMFVALQLARAKPRRLDQTAITNEVRRRWPEIKINPDPDRISDPEFEKLSSLKATFGILDSLTRHLVPKHMFLMVRDCKDNLYISDNPLVMHNQRTFGPYGNIGLAVLGIEIYYPLSPNVVLTYFCPSSLKLFEEKQIEAERQVSSFFATKLVSRVGLSMADTVLLAEMRAEIKRSKDYYRLLKEHRVVPMDAQNVLYLNSLQMMSSHRFIAAQKADFSFARNALKEKPSWREGRGIQFA
jgi:hypothetical protein